MEAEGGQMSESNAAAMDETDCSDAEFWNSLESTVVDRFQGIPIMPEKFSRGSRNPSRISRLSGRANIGGNMACGHSSRPAI